MRKLFGISKLRPMLQRLFSKTVQWALREGQGLGFSLPLVDDLVNLARTSFHRELPKTCRENVFKMQVFHVPIPLLLCQSLRFTSRMKVTCRPKFLDRFRFSTHVFFSSPNFSYELQYKHLAMKFEDSESRGQILISRHSTPTFPQKRFPAAVDALCFHPCRPRRFKPTAHTSLAMPPCHLSAAP